MYKISIGLHAFARFDVERSLLALHSVTQIWRGTEEEEAEEEPATAAEEEERVEGVVDYRLADGLEGWSRWLIL